MIPAIKRKQGSSNKFLTSLELEHDLVGVKSLRQGAKGATIVKGHEKATRRPQTFAASRTCYCGKKLSIYNKGPNCYQHSPVRHPRVRGNNKVRIPPEDIELLYEESAFDRVDQWRKDHM